MSGLTKDSETLLTDLITKNNINYTHHKSIQKTTHIFKHLYSELTTAQTSLIKEVHPNKIVQIKTMAQISKPKTFKEVEFPSGVIEHINKNSKTEYLYTFSLFHRIIKVYFIDEQQLPIEYYNNAVKRMLLWFYILAHHTSDTCSKTISVFIYLTSLKKTIPDHHSMPFTHHHANTGFTRTCISDSEIVIYRKEEWFKVFLHESIHNFAIDFSDMDIDHVNKQILQLYPGVNSEVTLFESYTEFWAEIMNVVICSFILTKSYKEYLKYCDFFINCERNFGIFQLVKILKHMDLTYSDIIKDKEESISNSISKSISKSKYKEETNILSYYILKNVLLNNYQDFLLWCEKNNKGLFQFIKSEVHLQLFYQFIKRNYKSPSMLGMIKHAETTKNIDKNMRMTCLEI
jgi:hypothetical protein